MSRSRAGQEHEKWQNRKDPALQGCGDRDMMNREQRKGRRKRTRWRKTERKHRERDERKLLFSEWNTEQFSFA